MNHLLKDHTDQKDTSKRTDQCFESKAQFNGIDSSVNIKEELIENDVIEPVPVKLETIKTEPIEVNAKGNTEMEIDEDSDTIEAKDNQDHNEVNEDRFKCQVCSSKFLKINELKSLLPLLCSSPSSPVL